MGCPKLDNIVLTVRQRLIVLDYDPEEPSAARSASDLELVLVVGVLDLNARSFFAASRFPVHDPMHLQNGHARKVFQIRSMATMKAIITDVPRAKTPISAPALQTASQAGSSCLCFFAISWLLSPCRCNHVSVSCYVLDPVVWQSVMITISSSQGAAIYLPVEGANRGAYGYFWNSHSAPLNFSLPRHVAQKEAVNHLMASQATHRSTTLTLAPEGRFARY